MSAAYGWTTDYIWTRTMREVSWRLQAIHAREVEQLSFEAKLHGMELNLPDYAHKPDAPQANRLSDSDQAMLDEYLKRRQAEKFMEARGV